LQILRLAFIVFVSILVTNVLYANAQLPQLATFRENARVIVDQIDNQETIASIILQTTSTKEIKIPAELEQKIRDSDRVLAVIITNETQCVLGVQDEICVLINISMEGIEGGIIPIQDTAREIGDSLIDDINAAFGLETKPHSTFIHTEDTVNRALETSGLISGRGTVSAVYTSPYQETSALYEKLGVLLLHDLILEAGGFLETGKNLSFEDNSTVIFSIIPQEDLSLLQLKVSAKYPVDDKTITSFDPLVFLKTKKLEKADFFSKGFYPLNSLFQFIILSNEPIMVDTTYSNIVPIAVREGERVPVDLTKKGWFFDSDSGTIIDGKYLFGTDLMVTHNELVITLTPFDEESAPKIVTPIIEIDNFDESLFVLLGIGVVGVAAAVYYLKGYRK